MKKEEFLNILNQYDGDWEVYCERRDRFKEDMAKRLCAYATEQHPALQEVAGGVAKLQKHAETCAMMMHGNLYHAFELAASGRAYSYLDFAPKIKTRAESEAELEELLKIIPSHAHEEFREEHWGAYEEEVRSQRERKDFHDFVKSVLFEHYREEILKLESQSFYFLEDASYMELDSFLDQVYALIEFREEDAGIRE